MTTLDKHANISPALALEFEGRAKNTGLSAEDYLRELMDRPHPTSARTRERKIRVKELYDEGMTDREIAEEIGMSQSGVQRLRNVLGLPARRRGRPKARFDVHGHEYTPENTYVSPATGRRKCRLCMKDNAKKQAQRRKQESLKKSTEENL